MKKHFFDDMVFLLNFNKYDMIDIVNGRFMTGNFRDFLVGFHYVLIYLIRYTKVFANAKRKSRQGGHVKTLHII